MISTGRSKSLFQNINKLTKIFHSLKWEVASLRHTVDSYIHAMRNSLRSTETMTKYAMQRPISRRLEGQAQSPRLHDQPAGDVQPELGTPDSESQNGVDHSVLEHNQIVIHRQDDGIEDEMGEADLKYPSETGPLALVPLFHTLFAHERVRDFARDALIEVHEPASQNQLQNSSGQLQNSNEQDPDIMSQIPLTDDSQSPGAAGETVIESVMATPTSTASRNLSPDSGTTASAVGSSREAAVDPSMASPLLANTSGFQRHSSTQPSSNAHPSSDTLPIPANNTTQQTSTQNKTRSSLSSMPPKRSTDSLAEPIAINGSPRTKPYTEPDTDILEILIGTDIFELPFSTCTTYDVSNQEL
jgi:hypothetical protein